MVLETGVGTSRNNSFYLPGTEVVAVDWSSNVLEGLIKILSLVAMMKPRTVPITYLLEDVEKLSFTDNYFDTVIDTFGLEYYANPEKATSEMKRVCKKVNIFGTEHRMVKY